MSFSGIVIFFWKGQTISIKVCFICHSILKIICQLKKLKSIETIVLVSFSLSSGICEDFFSLLLQNHVNVFVLLPWRRNVAAPSVLSGAEELHS